MPLGLGIVEALRAIPPRIEVAGHGPTVRITAGSFDAALDYARECHDAPAVLDSTLRHRLWPRVTITVTTDPELARSAPPVEELRRRVEEQGAALRARRSSPAVEPESPRVAPERQGEVGLSTLEEIFADQERARQLRAGIPAQRRTSH